jgi:hypothetical protein
MLYSENLYASRKPTSLRVSKDREEDTNPLSEIGKGFSAGIDQLQGLIGGGGKALAGSLFGNDEWFVDGMQYYNEQMTDAMRNEAAVGSLEEIDGFVDGVNYTAYIIGNLGSSLLGGGISGAAGGAIAKGGLKKIAAKAMDKAIKPSAEKLAKRQGAKNFAKTKAGQEALGKKAVRGQIGGALAFGTAAGAGESFTKVLEEGGEEAPIAALITGVASGALDQYTPMRALKRILPQKTFKDASEAIAGNIAKQPSMAKRIIKEGAKSAGAEGVVEGLQEVIQNATLEYIRSDNPQVESSWLERMTSEDKLSQYLNSAVAGIIGGAAIGGVSGIAKDPRSEISSPTNLLEYDGDANKIPDQRLAEEEPVQNEPPKTEQPEVIDLPQDKVPSLDSLSGQDVTYQGVQGVLTKRDEGFFVVSQDEDIFIESGEAQSPEQLGIIPTDENVVFENDVTIDPESKKFILRGKEFTLTTIRRDDKGNPISLAVRDEKGKNKTIREPEIVKRIEAQINKPQGYTGTLIPLDDLPVSIQEVIVQRGAESGTPINDEVSVDEALEIAELLPETDKQSAVLEIEESVQSSMQFKPTDKKFFSESKYVGSVRRPAQVSLPEAIAEVNKELGAERTPIDEERLKTTLSIANPEVVDGNPVVGAEEFYGDDAPKNEILNAVVDLIEMGMPKSVLNDFQGIGIHDPALHPSMKNSDGSYSMNAGYVSLKKGYVNNLANNSSDAERIRYTIAHEIGHAFDVNNNITDNSVEFYAEINGMGANGLDVELGDVLFELGQNYEQKTELGREMSYPFGHIFSWVNARPDKAESVINVLKKEAFAQAFAVLHSNPELLESSAPTTYNYLVKLLREPSKETNQNAQNDNQAEATVGELGEVQGEVRSRAESRGVQVQDREGDQLSRGDGARQEQASPIVEGSPEREDRVDTGQPVQLDSDFQEQQAREEQRLDEEVSQLDIEDDLASFDDDFDPMDDIDDLQSLFAPVSTRFPTGAKATEDPVADLIVNDYDSFVENTPLFSKNMLLVKKYNNLTKREQKLSDKNASKALIAHIKENLLSIFDAVPEATRAISKQWYKGANKIVQRMADRHGVSLAQASAVAANLSPQKDWYQNASLAERVLDIFHNENSAIFDDQMKAKAEEIYFHKDVSKKSRISNRRMLGLIGDKSLQQLIDEGASLPVIGMWIRTWDQTFNDPSYRLVSPDGKFLDYAVNADGNTQSRVAWGSLNEIGKAVSVLLDSSQENVSRSLGSRNKVRNFYNNIFNPDAEDGFVTIDTHAVAAGLMKPLSGDSLEVGHNFGTGKGSSSSIVTGHSGTYSIFEEAYRQAAIDRGVLAREMQSITWEAVRGLFTPAYKAQDQNVLFVENVWNQYNKGKINLEEARSKINDHSGGIQRPDWERSDFTVPDEVSATSYQRKLSDSSVPRSESGSQEAAGSGTGIDATRVPTDTEFLSSPPREEDSNISDLSARREQKGLQDFKSRMMNNIQQQVSFKNKIVKKLVSDGAFEGFEAGKRYTSKNPNQDTFGFKSEITGLSITEVTKRDRDLNSPTVKLFGQIPESAIIVGDNGKEYTANINTKVINSDGDENISSAALWKVKKQFSDGDAKFMGGLRSVQDEDFLSSPPRQETAPNLTPEEANAAQNARIREEKSFIDKATDWASRTFRRNLAPQGLLNDEVFESKIKRDGELGAVEIDIRMHIAAYDEAIKEAYPEGTDVPESLLNDALQVPVEQLESLDIPKAVKEVIGRMRRYIDKYSADYSTVIQSQLDALDSKTQTKEIEAKQSLLSTFKSNLGKYLNRSYRAFDDPNWAKSVPDDVLNDAKEYLAENGATNVERVINTILKEGTAFDGIGSFIVNSKLGAKDLSILKKKNNTIAPEILALLGEYKEPRINFVKTATKLSRLVFNHKFLEDVKAKGEGVFLFTAETAPSDAYVQLAAEQSSVMAPLNGYYVTPELKQGFAEANGLKSLDGMYRNLVALNSIVKYGKTVIAPTTIARNFMSAGFFTVANGHFDWSKTLKSIEVFKSYFNSKEGDATAFLRELKRLSVVYDTPIAGEMIKAMEDSGVDALENSLIGSDLAKGKVDKAKSNAQKVASFFTKFYQYGDDFWKIVGFMNEMDMLMEAKGLSYEDAAPIAAERIRNTYPTYSLIGRAMQQLRRFPLAGTFVSFPAEIIRTSFNMFKYLKQDMADPDMRASAHRRLAGMALVSGGIYAIQAAAFAAWDVSEEEEEAIRLMSPEWSRNSNIVVTGRDEKGDLEYVDLTYLDPYAYWKRPINALLRDQPLDDALAQSAQEMLSPFFGKDISAGTVFNLMINEKDSGGRIYNPADTASNITVDMTGFMIKNMAPSALQNANRISKAFFGEVSKSGKKYEMRDEMLALVGFRSTTFDPKVSLHFKAYEFNQDKRDATSLLTSTFRDPNEVSNGDLINAFERASRARREGFERMIKLVSAARSSGLTDTELMMVLRSNGVTRKDARSLVKGDYEAWAMSDSTLKNTIKKSDLLFGEAKGREFEERWKLIQELLSREM